MKFSKDISKAVTSVMALFQKQLCCSSNKATTICGQAAESLRRVPVRHNREGVATESKVQFVPPTMCRLTYEKKIDKILNAGKPVKKELDVIRKRTKELPALLGGEKSIKISEQDFERVMDMAQASGTLQKLNEAYDIDMERMQIKIEKLTSQVQILTAKLVKAESFLKMKKLFEEFKEYLKPKSIKKSLQGKKRSVEEYDKVHLRDEVKKDKGIAI